MTGAIKAQLGQVAFAHSGFFTSTPAEALADKLVAEILRVGPERVMAFIAEPVGGAALGAVPAVQGYFARIRAICDRYGVLLILEEVMCGMGRTSKAPFDPALKIAPKIKYAAFQRGLTCYPMQGTIDGQFGDHALLAPPFIMDDMQLGDMVTKLKAAMLADIWRRRDGV